MREVTDDEKLARFDELSDAWDEKCAEVERLREQVGHLHAKAIECVNCTDWYVRCLDDVRRQIPVRNLDEAERSFMRARNALVDLYARKEQS